MAEAFLNKLSLGRARATSAGTHPAETIDPTVVKVMHEVGIDISHQKPKRLTPEMMAQVGRIITMGCGVKEVCLATFMKTEDWNIDAPKGEPIEKVRQIREQIQVRVRELLEEIPEQHE